VRPKKPLYYEDNNDEDAIVKAYTSRKVVVIFEPHNWTCSYPTPEELPLMIAWHVERANRYKNNPYVWFNVANELGGEGEASSQWLEVHRAVIKAIRATGAKNIIVCDGASCGQDTGVWDDRPVKEKNSAILSFGPHLARDAGGEFDNILFSLHTYDQWRFGDQKLQNYIERVHKKKLALMIGETGAPFTETGNRHLSTATTYRVALPLGVGILAWHAQPGDGFSLCTGKPGGIKSTDDPNNPTNLTEHGKLLWEATHSRSRK
jgi:mannan endo-1,4-beta-mannosidase